MFAAVPAEEASNPAPGLIIVSLGTALGSEGVLRGRAEQPGALSAGILYTGSMLDRLAVPKVVTDAE